MVVSLGGGEGAFTAQGKKMYQPNGGDAIGIDPNGPGMSVAQAFSGAV
jgi:hypothetical protein